MAKRRGFFPIESEVEEVKEELVEEIIVAPMEVEEVKPIYIGVATCDIDGVISKGEEIPIFEDAGASWDTGNGLISKLYLLLRKI